MNADVKSLEMELSQETLMIQDRVLNIVRCYA